MSEECGTAVQRLNEVFDTRLEITDRPRARSLDTCAGRL